MLFFSKRGKNSSSCAHHTVPWLTNWQTLPLYKESICVLTLLYFMWAFLDSSTSSHSHILTYADSSCLAFEFLISSRTMNGIMVHIWCHYHILWITHFLDLNRETKINTEEGEYYMWSLLLHGQDLLGSPKGIQLTFLCIDYFVLILSSAILKSYAGSQRHTWSSPK